jgi:16S rRNA (cytosine967-C5)-methyltransferase
MKYLQSAIVEIINSYEGRLPLVHFLKKYYKAHPKLGSRDRKAISDAVYSYFRLAKFTDSPKDNILPLLNYGVAHGIIKNPTLQRLAPSWTDSTITLAKDIHFEAEFSSGIQKSEWINSMKQLPCTFIRIRVAAEKVLAKLKEQNIAFEQLSSTCFRFENGIDLAAVLPEHWYVIQDYSSQRSLDLFFEKSPFKKEQTFSVWDTCSGAGGKMLLLKDHFPNAQILCTDVRATILHNLKERARRYKQQYVSTQVLDSANLSDVASLHQNFDCVLSDVPCSGSGTWARTPENFFFFEEKNISSFSDLQFKIANNAVRKVKPAGYFIYITCSVFKEENEKVVERLLAQSKDMSLVEMRLIKGIEDNADCMFAALMKKH